MLEPKMLGLSIVCILNTMIKEKPNQIMLDGKAIKSTDMIKTIEKRTCYVLKEIEFFTNYLSEWKGLKKIFAVKREVERWKKQAK